MNDSIEGRSQLVGITSSKAPIAVSAIREWMGKPGVVTRNFGSTALHLAFVASGALDAAYSVKGKIWDIAAGALLITEAGGVITNEQGADPFPFTPDADAERPWPVLAGCRVMHRKLMPSIKRAIAEQART